MTWIKKQTSLSFFIVPQIGIITYIVLDSTALITEVDLYKTGKNHICISKCSKIKRLNYTCSLSQPYKSDKKVKTVALSVDSMRSS